MPVCRQTDRFMNRAHLITCLRFQWIHVTPLSLRADPVCLRSTVLAPHEWNGAALAPGPSWLLCPKSALACRWDLLMEIKGLSSPYTPTQTHIDWIFSSFIQRYSSSKSVESVKKWKMSILALLISHTSPDIVLLSYGPIKSHRPQRKAVWAGLSDSWRSSGRV